MKKTSTLIAAAATLALLIPTAGFAAAMRRVPKEVKTQHVERVTEKRTSRRTLRNEAQGKSALHGRSVRRNAPTVLRSITDKSSSSSSKSSSASSAQ